MADTQHDDDNQFAEVTDTLPLPSDHPDGQDSTGGNAPHQPADIPPTPPDEPTDDKSK